MLAQSYTDQKASATGRVWKLAQPDPRLVMAMSQQHNISELLANILCARGVALEEAGHFLNPSLKNALPDPSHLLDMDIAAKRLATAVINRETIGIFGDYDVDGATSSALLMRYFRALGLSPLVHIPDRMKEGYGPNAPALLALKDKGASVVVTVDCGTLAFEPIETAANAGLDVIVLDHHLGDARRPKALAIVNPNRLDETSPHRQLAAVGITFLTLIAINRELRARGFFASMQEPNLLHYLDIVALGTICDVVPLTGVNRALVCQGLKVMANRGNPGMCAVMDVAGLDEKPSVYTCGFVIGPRINAGGRVGRSDLGVRLLTTDDPAEALSLARELDLHNAERKAIESHIQDEANIIAESLDTSAPILVVAGKGWHSGVIGIVAGRLKERHRKPVAVIGINDGIGKASARSTNGMDLGAAIIAAKNEGILIAGGGHAMAAGFTVEEANIPALTAFLHAHLKPHAHHLDKERSLPIDVALSIGSANIQTAGDIEKLGPFGQSHYPIRVMLSGVMNLKPELAGELHVKTLLICRVSNARIPAISFRCTNAPLGNALFASRGQAINVVGQLRLQEWQGRQNVSLMIEDISVA